MRMGYRTYKPAGTEFLLMSGIRAQAPTPIDHGAYSIRFSQRRRDPAVIVHHNLRVEVVVPPGTPAEVIEDLYRRSTPWIARTLARFRERQNAVPERSYTSGERFLLGGEEYRLVIEPGESTTVSAERGVLRVIIHGDSPREEVRALVIGFYEERAIETIGALLAIHAPRFGRPVPPFRVRLLRRRWGSCSQAGRLNFNLRLAMAPPAQIEYVVVHELCHLLHPNHSPAFWRAVEQYLPDYQVHRQALREAGSTYVL